MLDVDRPKKDGDPDGCDTLRDLVAEHGPLPLTRMQMTPSGGAHYYFKMPADGRDIRNSAKKIAPGLDIRGTGGYFCYYGENNDFDIADPANWILDLIEKVKKKPDPAPATNTTPRLSGSWRNNSYIEKAVSDELTRLASAGSGHRNETLNEVAFALGQWVGGGFLGEGETRDMLLNGASSCGLLQDDGMNSVQKTINSGLEAGKQNPRTPPDPETRQNEGIEGSSKPEQPEGLFTVLSGADLLSLPRPMWRVKGLLPQCGTAVIHGVSGSGKTFTVLDLALATALEEKWFGWKTVHCDILYICLESIWGLQGRLNAWTIDKQRGLPENIRFIIEPFDLGNKQHVKAISAIAPKGGVIVIDTLNRSTPGMDENSSKDMSQIISATNEIQTAMQGLVLLVSHSGKDTSKGIRGHSSLFAALDANIEVVRNGDARSIKVGKVKEGEDGAKRFFRLKPVVIGTDEDGEITSCVVEPVDESQAGKGDDRPLTKSQEYGLETLVKALRHEGTSTVKLEVWRERFYTEHWTDNDGNLFINEHHY